MHVVVLQHLTPDLIRRPDFLQHTNTAIGVNSMSAVIFDADRVAARMAALLGNDAVAVVHDGVHLTLPTGQRVHLLLPDAYEDKFGDRAPDFEHPRLGAMEIRVSDLSQTETLLVANEIDTTHAEPACIRVSSAHCCGVVLDFSEAPASLQCLRPVTTDQSIRIAAANGPGRIRAIE